MHPHSQHEPDLADAIIRSSALLAAALIDPGGDVLTTAGRLAAWAGRYQLPVTVSPLTTKQGSDRARATTYTHGGKAVQLHDDEEFILTIESEDAKGFTVNGDAVTFTPADTSVATVEQSDDGLSATVIAGNPGSTTIMINDANGTVPPYTEAVDVVPGDAVTFTVTEGTPTKQNAGA